MINSLRRFFEINTVLVFFVYGQVFFVLGLAIALQSWRHTRLELARSLRWLAAFGIVHGIHEWGTFFIPIQASYISKSLLNFLLFIQVVSLAVSFSFLFQFGVDLFRQRWPRLIYLPTIAVIVWAILFLIPNSLPRVWSTDWHQDASIWARYMLAFPAGLLSAVGLRYQAKRQIKPLNLNHIYRTFRVAGIALGAYAIVSGIIISPGNIFPANMWNTVTVVNSFGIPVPVLRSLAGLVIAVAIIRALEVFNVETDRRIEEMEIEQSLMAERERIGRELHDGAIQKVYTAGLMIESMRSKVNYNPLLHQRIDRAMNATNEAITSLRTYMIDLRPKPVSIPLADALQKQTSDLQLQALIRIELIYDLPDSLKLKPVQTARVLAILREALANAARHSQAHHVTVLAKQENTQLILSIIDDGCGFSAEQNGTNFGIRDMRDQARLLGGILQIKTETDQGTQITLTLPLEDN